eukprot:2135228-Prorocentrum_lima.AAC.1
MTSSLVGSEMCIRDSFIHYLVGANQMIIEYIPSQENPAYTLTKGLTAACLLYTSDAADDM